MAVVFFDSFSLPDTQNWTFTSYGLPNPYGYQNIGYFPDGALNEGVSLFVGSGNASGNVPTARLAFPAQTSGKVYIGFRMERLQRSSLPEHKFCAFYDDANTEICSISLDTGGGVYGGISGYDFAVKVRQGGTLRDTYYLANPLVPFTSNHYVSQWHHWEFELDIDNDTLALRVEGQLLFEAPVGGLLTLATPFSSVAGLAFFGVLRNDQNGPQWFDDLYVLNDSGSYNNSWLGPTARVRTRTIAESEPYTNVNWEDAPSANLSSNDGDGSYVRTKQVGAVYAVPFNALSLPSGSAIGAVKVSSISRAPVRAVAYKHAFVDTVGEATYELGDPIVIGENANINYPDSPLVTYAAENPATGLPWTPEELDTLANHFGMKTVALPEP